MDDRIERKLIFQSRGNIELLSRDKLLVLASRNHPAAIEREAIELFSRLQKTPLSLASGWQSPLEKVLYRMSGPRDTAGYLRYLARELNAYHSTKMETELIDIGKLLLIAPDISRKRADHSLVEKRNDLMLQQMDKILFLYLAPGGQLCNMLTRQRFAGHTLFLLDHPANRSVCQNEMKMIEPINALDLLV